jgi:hypothetical protein
VRQEDSIMTVIFDWVRIHKFDNFIFHIANERRTSPQAGALLKRMGVKAGVSDIFIARPSRGYHGMFMEIKSEKGKVSPSQKAFLHNMKMEGYEVAVAYGADEAIAWIQAYLDIIL